MKYRAHQTKNRYQQTVFVPQYQPISFLPFWIDIKLGIDSHPSPLEFATQQQAQQWIDKRSTISNDLKNEYKRLKETKIYFQHHPTHNREKGKQVYEI